jgi:ABC-type antimicrobial peptide transport system permease subunit
MPEQRHRLLLSEMFRLSLRNFRVKPVRAILTILGMSIGFGVVLFLVSLGYGLQYILIGNLVTTEDSLVTMQANYPSEANLIFYSKEVSDIAALPNVAEVLPIANFSEGEASQTSTSSQTALVSMDIVEPAYFRLTGTAITYGTTFSTSSPGAVVTSQTLTLMNLSTTTAALGTLMNLSVVYEDDLHGTSTTAKGLQPIPIVGIIEDDTQAPLIILSPEQLSNQPPFYQSVLVKAKSIDSVEAVRTELTDKGLIVIARVDLVNQARQITNIITLVLGVFGITALVVSAIGMFNTMIVSFMERTYEVGVLKSLGATDTDVRNLFLLEAAVYGFMGGASGVTLGFLAGQGVNLGLNILAKHLGGKGFTLFITPLWFIALTIGLAILIGLISGFWPAYRASRLSAKEAFLQR